MGKYKIRKRIISLIIAVTTAFTAINASSISVKAFDMDYISTDGMELGYSIINGYSKLSVEKGLTSYEKSAVYSGLDITSPYIITLAGLFYVTNGIDFDKAMEDNNYAIQMISKFDGFLNSMGVKNEKAKILKAEFRNSDVKILNSFDTAGLYIIEADEAYCKNLLGNKNVDFILSGGAVPKSLKDLNMDGKSDVKDGELIQQFLVENLKYKDKDITEYLKFACDINGDKEINILDTTELQTKM